MPSGKNPDQSSKNRNNHGRKGNLLLPQLIPHNDIIIPQGTTHLKFRASATKLNFKNSSHKTIFIESPGLKAKSKNKTTITLSGKLTPLNNYPRFLAFGIGFFSNNRDISIPVKRGKLNPLCIITVALPSQGSPGQKKIFNSEKIWPAQHLTG